MGSRKRLTIGITTSGRPPNSWPKLSINFTIQPIRSSSARCSAMRGLRDSQRCRGHSPPDNECARQYVALFLPPLTVPLDFGASFTSSVCVRGEADGEGVNHTRYVAVNRDSACSFTASRMSMTCAPVIEKRLSDGSLPVWGSFGPGRRAASKLRPPVHVPIALNGALRGQSRSSASNGGLPRLGMSWQMPFSARRGATTCEGPEGPWFSHWTSGLSPSYQMAWVEGRATG